MPSNTAFITPNGTRRPSLHLGAQFAVTTAVALYQFATLGLRLYFPVGFAALFIAGLWFARQPR